MDQNPSHNRKKRARKYRHGDSSSSSISEKKTKHSKKQEQQQFQDCYSYEIDTTTSATASDSDAAALRVFDFPWLKDGVGTVRSEKRKLEDGFVSQLQKETDEISAGIGFPFPESCLFSRSFPISDYPFPTEPFAVEDYERCRSLPSPLEDIGLETAESIDRIWTAFA